MKQVDADNIDSQPKINKISKNLTNTKIKYNNPIFYIYYDSENTLQVELVESIQQNLFNLKQKIELIDINTENINTFLNNEDLAALKTQSEPKIIYRNNNILEPFNAFSLSNVKHKTQVKIDNLTNFYKTNELRELREHLRYLENPKNRVIVFNSTNLEQTSFRQAINLFLDKNTKILQINNEELVKDLKIDSKDCLYIYYPPKLPFKIKNSELNNIPNESEKDLNQLLSQNVVSFVLKYNFFRDEIKIDEALYKNNINQLENSELSLLKRQDLIKRITYPKRGVLQLAVTSKKEIDLILNQKNNSDTSKHYLYIYVPNYAFLKEQVLEHALITMNNLFDKIFVTDSKNFTIKQGLYDATQITEELPQIYLIEKLSNSNTNKVFSLSFFKFIEDFKKYTVNKLAVYKHTPPIENFSYVTTVNTGNFENLVLKDNSFREFLIEIKHAGCPTCYMLGKMFDHLSQKFKKHSLDKKIKFFRIDTANDLKYLGEFAATPTYLFVRKDKNGNITKIEPLEKGEFLHKIKQLSNYDLSKIRYHPNIGFGFFMFQNKEFLKPDYDPDMDISSFKI